MDAEHFVWTFGPVNENEDEPYAELFLKPEEFDAPEEINIYVYQDADDGRLYLGEYTTSYVIQGRVLLPAADLAEATVLADAKLVGWGINPAQQL